MLRKILLFGFVLRDSLGIADVWEWNNTQGGADGWIESWLRSAQRGGLDVEMYLEKVVEGQDSFIDLPWNRVKAEVFVGFPKGSHKAQLCFNLCGQTTSVLQFFRWVQEDSLREQRADLDFFTENYT